jgi:hypothetical protein
MQALPLVGLHGGHVNIGGELFFEATMEKDIVEHQSKKRNLEQRSPLTEPVNTNVRNFPRFLVMETAGASDKTIASLSPFIIERAMKGISESIEKVKKLRSGALLIEVTREAQAKNLLTVTEFASIPVTVSAHRSLNSSKGVIRSSELAKLSDDELLAELSSQGVTAIKNIFQTRDGQRRKTNTIILTFALATPPSRINAGYESCTVSEYIPNPLRCFRCQQFGHGQSACTKAAMCAKCGMPAHGTDDCSRNAHCTNCGGEHPAFAPVCPKFIREKEICKVKVTQGLSFTDAKKVVEARTQTVNTGVSYSAVAAGKPKMQSVATQTDLIECKCPAVNIVPDNSQVKASKATNTVTAQQSKTTIKSAPFKTTQSTKNSVSNDKPSTSKPNRTRSSSPISGVKPTQTSSRGKIEIKSGRLSKGSQDPIKTFNKFQDLDDMEGDGSESELLLSRQPFKANQIVPPK